MARTSVLAAVVVLLTATSVGRAQAPVHFRYNLANQRTYLLTPDGLSWHTARDSLAIFIAFAFALGALDHFTWSSVPNN